MAGKTSTTRPIAALTGAVTVWTWIYMAAIALWLAGTVYRFILLGTIDPYEPLTSIDPIPGHDAELLLTSGAALLTLVASLVTGFLVLRWCHRASRNSNAMARSVEIRPHWAIWWWFIPVASLFMPYKMFSEFWRVSESPDRWKGARDPGRLRWWWGLHLTGGILGLASNAADRAFATAGDQMIGTGMMIAMMVVQLSAGLLFVGIVRTIGRRQTSLIAEGRTNTPPDGIPGWAP